MRPGLPIDESARIELAHDGIAVTKVVPSRTNTGFGTNAARIGSTDDFFIDEETKKATGAPKESHRRR